MKMNGQYRASVKNVGLKNSIESGWSKESDRWERDKKESLNEDVFCAFLRDRAPLHSCHASFGLYVNSSSLFDFWVLTAWFITIKRWSGMEEIDTKRSKRENGREARFRMPIACFGARDFWSRKMLYRELRIRCISKILTEMQAIERVERARSTL